MGLVVDSYRFATAGFEPTDIAGLVGWWDASDAATITASGSDVTQWADKSGGGYHFAQGTAGKYPQTGTATINSKNVLSFDGSADSMSVASFAGLNGSEYASIFYVAESSATGDRVVLELSVNYNTNTGFITYQMASTRYVLFGISLAVNAARTNTALSGSTPFVVSHTADRTIPSGLEVDMWLDGAAGKTSIATGNATGSFTTQGLFLGARNNSSLRWSGKIAEICIYDTVLDTTDRGDVESYLADKWGITL